MTYRELKEYLDTLLPEELDRPVVIVDYQTQGTTVVENIVHADGVAGTHVDEAGEEIQAGDPILLVNCYSGPGF